jgi:hypothetical protein
MRLVAIARSRRLPYNVDQSVSSPEIYGKPTTDGRRGYRFECESVRGQSHNTKVSVIILPNANGPGSLVDVVPWTNTPGWEANDVARALERLYFSSETF